MNTLLAPNPTSAESAIDAAVAEFLDAGYNTFAVAAGTTLYLPDVDELLAAREAAGELATVA